MTPEEGFAVAEVVITAIEKAIALYRAHQGGHLTPDQVLAQIGTIAMDAAAADAAGDAAAKAKQP